MKLLPFRNGVFKIAKKAGSPIVVLCITGAQTVSQKAPFRHTDVHLDVPEVFSPQNIKATKTEMIGTAVRRLIETNIEKEDA